MFCFSNKTNPVCFLGICFNNKASLGLLCTICRLWAPPPCWEQFLDFLAPPHKKIGYLNTFLSKMKKKKVVENCLKWRENWSKMIFGFSCPPPQPSQAKSWHGELRCSHSAHLTPEWKYINCLCVYVLLFVHAMSKYRPRSISYIRLSGL